MHKVEIVKYFNTDPRLGRHVEHDSRSLAYPVTAEVPKELTDVFWPDVAPVLDQGNLGACVGFTGADFLNTTFAASVRTAVNKGSFFDNTDGGRFYHLATLSDNIAGTYPPDDTGSSGLGLAKALKKLGYIKSYLHAFTWAQFQSAIATQPVCMGTLWTNGMFKCDSYGVIHVGSLSQDNIAGGHEWMIRGISYTKGLCLGRNHWSAKWDTVDGEKNVIPTGNKVPGEFWIPIKDVQKLLLSANQGDVTVLKI